MLSGAAAIIAGLALSRTGHAAEEPADRGILVARGRTLAVVHPAGDERQLATLEVGAFASDVAWSPDGSRIAFSQYTARRGEGPGGADILVLPASGAAEPLFAARRERPGTLLGSPVWLPDGSGLLFETVGGTPLAGPIARVEQVGVDGSGRRMILADARQPALSRDGSRLAFVRPLPDGDALMVGSPGGGDARMLVPPDKLLALAYPRFAPDGSQIAFVGVGSLEGARVSPEQREAWVAAHGLPWSLFVVDATGGDARMVGQLAEDDAAVAWSPDGSSIAFSGAAGLKLVLVTDGSITQVNASTAYGGIDWR
ncbi:MAG: hypothetical protein U0821_16750 [Chloroflexota bacterium]